jgi:DNA-binding protein H-NS
LHRRLPILAQLTRTFRESEISWFLRRTSGYLLKIVPINPTAGRIWAAIPPNPTQTLFVSERWSEGDPKVKNKNLATMSAEELWSLREEIHVILSTKLDAEKHELERRLARLNGTIGHKQRARRPYPKVHPKYRNPERPSETWSGRGKQPRWVGAQLRSGMKVDDLLISRAH